MATKTGTVGMAARIEVPREDSAASAGNWGYWGLAVGIILVTLGLLYGSFFFLIS